MEIFESDWNKIAKKKVSTSEKDFISGSVFSREKFKVLISISALNLLGNTAV